MGADASSQGKGLIIKSNNVVNCGRFGCFYGQAGEGFEVNEQNLYKLKEQLQKQRNKNTQLKDENQILRNSRQNLLVQLNSNKPPEIYHHRKANSRHKPNNSSIQDKDLGQIQYINYRLSQENSRLKEQIIDLQKQCQNYSKKNTLTSFQKILTEENNRLTKEVLQYKTEINHLKQKNKIETKNQMSLKHNEKYSIWSSYEQNQDIIREPIRNDKRLPYIFQGPILQRQDNHKRFLLNQLEEKFKLTIIDTNLLYRFDPLNTTNFHKYIDNRSHIILIIKISQNQIFGAYSESAFSSKVIDKGSGMIFSLSNKKVFYLQNSDIPIVYDKNCLIFGNSQIRLKFLEDKVFSSFGEPNNWYNSKDYTTQILFGSKKNQQRLQTYEIYEIQIIDS